MGAASTIGSLIGLVGSAGGGKSGGSGQSSISPQEAALNAYMAQQQKLKVASDFGNTNTGLSTMKTVRTGGANIGGALANAQVADANAAQNQSLSQLAQQQSDFSQGAGSVPNNSTGNQTGNTFNSPSNASSGDTLVT